MSRIIELESQLAKAFDRLRAGLSDRPTPAAGDANALMARVAELEDEKAALIDELEQLRAKRDKDVAALDELISQLKPLIEEV